MGKAGKVEPGLGTVVFREGFQPPAPVPSRKTLFLRKGATRSTSQEGETMKILDHQERCSIEQREREESPYRSEVLVERVKRTAY